MKPIIKYCTIIFASCLLMACSSKKGDLIIVNNINDSTLFKISNTFLKTNCPIDDRQKIFKLLGSYTEKTNYDEILVGVPHIFNGHPGYNLFIMKIINKNEFRVLNWYYNPITYVEVIDLNNDSIQELCCYYEELKDGQLIKYIGPLELTYKLLSAIGGETKVIYETRGENAYQYGYAKTEGNPGDTVANITSFWTVDTNYYDNSCELIQYKQISIIKERISKDSISLFETVDSNYIDLSNKKYWH